MPVPRTEAKKQSATQQLLRSGVTSLSLLCLSLGAAQVTKAQQPPFAVTIIDWEANVLQRQLRTYRIHANQNEVLFCVVSWRTENGNAGFQRLTITGTRKEWVGDQHGIVGAAGRCVDDNNRPMPTIHTHTDGNCQLSPNDLSIIAAREAPFDGVQCGENHYVWAFAWQIKAIARNSAARDQDRPPPL